ncbi:MAG TPA: C45 family peptidase [Anaerolineales bacterium]|nr:C45 family peptidase [Anaerolineales bacterium]
MKENEQTHFGRPGDFTTVRHLTIHGTNFEIGHTLGKLAVERYGRTPAQLAAIPIYARARRIYIQRNYPIYWERMKGIAAAFSLDPEDDRYDLTALPHLTDLPMSAFGCSVVYYPPATTVTGRGYLSRNYDFFIGSMAEMLGMPLPPDVNQQFPPVMSEPYIMEWYPEDGGYASLAIHAFDTLSGTLDGINSAGLVVSILADNEAMWELGPKLELHPGPQQAIGLHEIAVMRLLLDTCATVAEAKEALLTIKQYYRFVPLHYIVADKAGHSFVYENSTGRNVQHVIEGTGQPQLVTNHQLHKHPTPETIPGGPPRIEDVGSFWRYRRLSDQIASHHGSFTPEEMKANNDCVNSLMVVEAATSADPARREQFYGANARTVWHSLYDQQAGTLEVSFYLGEEVQADGTHLERRSDYLKVALEAS